MILKFIKKIKNYKLVVPGSIKKNAYLIYNKSLKINVNKTHCYLKLKTNLIY